METQIEETTLVNRLREGDPGAYEQLVRTHADRVFGVAFRVLGNAADAEDAAQEAFLAAWKGMPGFDGRAALSTWLHRIAVNSALAVRRSKSRKREIAMSEKTPEQPSPIESRFLEWEGQTQPDPVERADVARLVWEAVDGLDDDYRVVLVLRDVEEMPSREVASQTGLSDAAVRQRLHRARQSIAEKLRPELCAGRRLTCGGRLDLLFDRIDQALPAHLKAPVEAHLASCPGCSDFLDKYRLTVAAPKKATEILGPKAPGRLVRSILARAPRPEK